jgi:hypothetical protein
VLGNSTGSANCNTGFTQFPFGINSTWYGAGAYAKYQFNDWFSLASRGEYLGSNNSGKFGAQGSNTTNANQGSNHVTGANWWEYTITAGFNVIDNLLLRAEYRLDWGSNINANAESYVSPGGGAGGGPCHYAGAEVVYSF